MRVCKNHVTQAIQLLNVPHIKKASIGLKCSICHQSADYNLYYTHKSGFKRKRDQWLASMLPETS